MRRIRPITCAVSFFKIRVNLHPSIHSPTSDPPCPAHPTSLLSSRSIPPLSTTSLDC